MKFNKHPLLEGQHAFLSPSKYSWVNYDEEKLEHTWTNWQQTNKGTEIHDMASKLIDLRIKLPRKPLTLNMYVNDAIGYRMSTEVRLFYSFNCFGVADAILFKDRKLRIHDLKTGKTPASMQQLRIYAALFCLEYGYNPRDLDIDLRIYQSNAIEGEVASCDVILYIMDKIVLFDKRINELKE